MEGLQQGDDRGGQLGRDAGAGQPPATPATDRPGANDDRRQEDEDEGSEHDRSGRLDQSQHMGVRSLAGERGRHLHGTSWYGGSPGARSGCGVADAPAWWFYPRTGTMGR